MSDQPTKKITVTATWQSIHTFQVPADADMSDLGELDRLLELIQLDPDGGGDIDPDQSELIDWEVW